MARPNLLIVMTDHQRGDTVLPGHPAITPNVARLAAEGVTFTDAYCPSPHCCPSRATFFTGLYPSRHGVWNNVCNEQALSRGPRPGVRLWSEDLAAAGYRQVFCGKWHVSVERGPADYGWEELFVSATGKEHHGRRWEHYRELAAQPEPAERRPGEILRPGYGTYRAYGSSPEAMGHDRRVTALAVEALRELAAGRQPWVLFVGFVGPHDPYVVPPEWLDLYPEPAVLPASFTDTLEDKPRVYRRLREQAWGQMSEGEIREAIRHYWAYCSALDGLFGQVLDTLDGSAAAGNTMVLYTSDHGDYCGDHGLFTKGMPAFRGAYHVPAVVRWPGCRQPGRQVGELVSLADFGPTFVEVGTDERGAPHPDPLPKGEGDCRGTSMLTGRSLAPFLRGERPAEWRQEMVSQFNGTELYYTQRSIRTKEWRYTFNGFDRDELYDLQADPEEMVNLADDGRYTGVKRGLVRRLWQFAEREGDQAINDYIMASLFPWGPAEAFR